MQRTPKTFSHFLSGLMLATGCFLTTNLPAVAGQSARDGTLSAEPRPVIPPVTQFTRLTGNPYSTLQHQYRLMEVEALTGRSPWLMAKSGSASAGGLAKGPAAPGSHIGSQHGSLTEVGADYE